MSEKIVKVGILGTGFGVIAMLPGFRLTPGAEVVAISSGRRERAEAAAREHGIPHAFDDHREMLDKVDLDLVAIASPVVFHHPQTVAALEKGCHIICEKPTAMNLAEARDMYERAKAAGVVHLIDHELRFNPTRIRLCQLLAEGYIGRVYHVLIQNLSPSRADPNQPWSWWSSLAQGGGALGANASHQVDLMRWWFGEITAVSGRINTFVGSRPDPQTGQRRVVDSDDRFAFMAEFASGAEANLEVSYVARQGRGNRVEIFGEHGSLVLDAQERLWGLRAGESQPTELTVADPLLEIPGVAASVWDRSFIYVAREVVAAIREGRPLSRGATFHDGAQNQAVLDAIRRSTTERRWVEVEKVDR